MQIYRLINMYWPPGRLIFTFVKTFELKFKSIIKKERKNICKLYRDGQFYWWMKPEYVEKTTDLTNFITLCCTPRDSNWLHSTKLTMLDEQTWSFQTHMNLTMVSHITRSYIQFLFFFLFSQPPPASPKIINVG